MEQLNYNLLNKYASNSPYSEHTRLIELDELKLDLNYYTFPYGTEPTDRPFGNLVALWRDENGKLMVTQTKALSHVSLIASSGTGKTQGPIIGSIFTMHPQMSGIYFDPKGELCSTTYERACEIYGKENISVINLMDPDHTIDFFNPFFDLAKKWKSAKLKSSRDETHENIISSINKISETLFPITDKREPSWELTARDFVKGLIFAFFEDLDLTETEAQECGREILKPYQITFENLYRIFQSFEWQTENFEDKGFLTKRATDSLAYHYTYSVINNAPNTRANYLQYADNFLRKYSLPEIAKITRFNTFDPVQFAKKPRLAYIIYDLSNEQEREFVNFMVGKTINDLLEISHKETNPLPVPTMIVADEFPTLLKSPIYPNLLATGRGSNLFMTMVCQSHAQLYTRYGDEATTMQDNCNIQIFEGTNEAQTAKSFSENLGHQTICDPSAFLVGEYREKTVPVVTQDYLLHHMQKGEAFVKSNNSLPLHSRFELYYKTPEFNHYPRTNLQKFKPKFPKNISQNKIRLHSSPYFVIDSFDDDNLPF